MSRHEPQAARILPPDAYSPDAHAETAHADLPVADPNSRNLRRLMAERRGRTRYPACVPAAVRLRGPGVSSVASQILDLSEDGIGVQTAESLHSERTLALELDLSTESDGRKPLRVVGQVAWAEPSGRVGVKFFSPDHATVLEIQQWLFLNAVARATQAARLQELLPHANQLATEACDSSSSRKPELFSDELDPEDVTQEHMRFPSLSPREADVNAIVSRALALTGAKGAALALYEGGQLICRAICGTDTPSLGATISTDSGITGECIRHGRVMYCADSATDPLVDREICADLGIRSILALPLYAGERLVGLLEVLAQRPGAFDPGDAKALDILARPVMGGLYAEGRSELLHRPAPSEFADGPSFRREPIHARMVHPEIDLASLDQQRRALARHLQRPKIYRRILEATAGVAVISAVGWLVVTQTKTLASLRQTPPVAVSTIPAEVPRQAPAPPPLTEEAKLAELKAAADKGDPLAQYAMGARYATGEGVAQDYATAARWFKLAADKGYAPAQGMLGAYYWSGRGIAKDLKKAYFWSVLARDGNDEISRDRVDALVPQLKRSQMLDVQQQVRDWNRKHPAQSQVAETSTLKPQP